MLAKITHWFKTLTLRKATLILFTLLAMFAPSGTRYILYEGQIAGHAVEPGTISLFGMQFVAMAFVACVFYAYGWNGIIEVARRPYGAFAAAVGFIAFMSSFEAADALAGVNNALFVAIGVCVFYATVIFKPDAREVLTAFVGGSVYQFLLGASQFYMQKSFASKWLGMAMHSADQLGAFVVETDQGRWLRAYGSLSHPNVFGLYVGIGLLMCVGLAAYRGHGKHAHYFGFMPLITAALLFSFSRSAMLAVVAGFVWIVMSAYGTEAAHEYRRVLLPSFMIIFCTLSTLGYFYSEPLRTRASAEGRLETRSITERTSQYEDAFSLLSRHVFTGVGIGQMPIALARETANERNWYQYDYVHNVPLLIAVETGLAGLAAWIGFVVSMLLTAHHRLQHRVPFGSGVTAYAAAFVAMLVMCLFDHFLWSSWFGQLIFWMVAGLLVSALHDVHMRTEQ